MRYALLSHAQEEIERRQMPLTLVERVATVSNPRSIRNLN